MLEWVRVTQITSDCDPHGLLACRLLCPWKRTGKNAGWVAIPFSHALFQTQEIKRRSLSLSIFFTVWTSGKPLLKNNAVGCRALLQDLSDHGIKPVSLRSLADEFFTCSATYPRKALICLGIIFKINNILSLHLDILPIVLQLIILRLNKRNASLFN